MGFIPRGSQNHRMYTAWLGLAGTSVGHSAQPPAQAGSPRAGCRGPCPGGSGVSPEKETPQPPWAAWARAPSPSEGRSSSLCSAGTSSASVCAHCPLSCRWAPLKRVHSQMLKKSFNLQGASKGYFWKKTLKTCPEESVLCNCSRPLSGKERCCVEHSSTGAASRRRYDGRTDVCLLVLPGAVIRDASLCIRGPASLRTTRVPLFNPARM